LGRRQYSLGVINIVIDTGVLYEPKKLRQLALRPDVAIWGSTINVFETVSDAVDEQTFKEVRSQMKLMLEVSSTRFLPDTDTQFRLAIGHPDVIDEPEEWRKVAIILSRAQNFAEASLEINFARAREMRKRHTDGWVDQLVDQSLRTVNPDLKSAPDWNVRASATELSNFVTWLESPAGKKEQLDAWFRRQGWDTRTVAPIIYEAARRVLSAYFQAHKGYLLDIFQFGRKPQPNDALDLDQVLPLWREGWMFVSADRRLLNCLELGGMQPHRYRSIRDLDPAESLG
jgi:hypothetical protein